MSWQKRARIVILVIAIGVATAVFVTTRRRAEPPPPAPVTRADPTAAVESSGAFLVQVKGDRETVTIRAQKQFSYNDGSSRLVGVEVTSVRQGKTFVATGAEAKIGENQANLEMNGNVRMTSSDGLEVSAGSAAYSQAEGVVRAPGPVVFKRGRMSGSGVGFSYDETRDLIGLADQTKVKIAASPQPGEKRGEATDITAGSAVLARKDKFVSFERAVHIVHGDQVITADSALGDLTADEQHLSGLDLQGNSRIETPKARPGEMKVMAGDVITMTYHENSELLQNAVITNSGSLRIAGDPGAPDRTLTAQNIDISMAPDGATVTSLNARDQVALEMPGGKTELAKSIRANSLAATGAAGQGLTAATFTQSVEYRETGGTPPVKRTVTSRDLELALNGGLGNIREATFMGSVRLRDESGGAAANAERMRYEIQTGQVELTSAPGGALPRVENNELNVDAERVEMSIEGSKMKATGAKTPVRTVMLPAKGTGKAGRRTPGIMQQDQPVNGTSRELNYTGGDASTAEFTGGVRLWQGEKADTVIQAEKVSVDSKTGNLAAQGSVLSMMLVQELNPSTKERETSRSTGHGQQMLYDDTLRTITYTTKARLIGTQSNLAAETIVVKLGAKGQDLEQLEATQNVELKEVDRVTTGDHLTYVAETAEYNMSGKGRLVRMLRTTADGCRRSEGSLLTFSRAADTLRIEGRPETRTQTSSDTACTPAAPKS
jgi:LPS export ABC transporter protein LptC